jgi:DNA-binding XRE family transcriptional regulator
MTLKEWMTKKGVTQTELANLVDVSHVCICNLLNGKKRVSEALAVRISKVTKGLVRPRDVRWPEGVPEDVATFWRSK